MIAENTTPEPESLGGLGGCAPWPSEDNRLIRKAVKERWPTGNGVQKAVDVTVKNMGDADPRVANVAVRNFISMVGQNMQQEERDNPTIKGSLVIHADVGQLERERAELLYRITGKMPARGSAAVLPGPGDGASSAPNGHMPPPANGASENLS